ncbi:MAG: metallophosphoesterase family protein [Actinobacteria bacterium]|nr:MAG: metallophosphoesterase family protein [Actinomycetota bacterium]
MKRVAALYDVHGNLPALEAVLAEVGDADLIVVGGDVVGGPFPAETVERLRDLGDRVRWLRGNAERELVEQPPPREAGPPPGELERLRAALSDEQVDFVYGLPERVELDVEGLGRVLFCHATPQNDLDIVTPLTPEERLRRILEGVTVDAVVAGHTHIQEDRRVGGVRWVNAGSVGMPYEDEPGACWALLGPEVELRRTEYDATKLGGYEYPQASRQEAADYFESLVRD